jgi:hypothetical protein
MSRWVIERGDRTTVRKDGRVVRQEDDMRAAVHLVQTAFEDGDTVFVRDDDGYQTNLTRKFRRGAAERMNW